MNPASIVVLDEEAAAWPGRFNVGFPGASAPPGGTGCRDGARWHQPNELQQIGAERPISSGVEHEDEIEVGLIDVSQLRSHGLTLRVRQALDAPERPG